MPPDSSSSFVGKNVLCLLSQQKLYFTILFSTRIIEICVGGVRVTVPSNCREAPVQEVHCWYFIQPPFPDTELSTASDSASRNMIFHVFGGRLNFSLPATKRGRHCKADQSAKWGQRNRCPQFHLSSLLPRHQQLYYISAVIEAIFPTLSQRWNSWGEVG